MKTNINNSIELAKSCINEFLSNKTNLKLSSFLDENIIITGFKDNNIVCGLNNLFDMPFMKIYDSTEPFSYEITNSQGFEISSNIFNVIIFIKNFTNSNINHSIELSLSLILDGSNNNLIIKSVTFSILNTMLKTTKEDNFIDFGGTLEFNLSEKLEIQNISEDVLLLSGYKNKDKVLSLFENCLINIIPIEEREKVLKNIQEGLINRNHYSITHHLICFDKSLIEVTQEGRINSNKNGKITVLAFIIKANISAPIYKNQVQYIDRLESVINSYPSPIFFKDLEGKYLGLNKAFLKFFKINNFLEVIGKTDFEIFDKDLANEILEEDKKALKIKKEISEIYKNNRFNDTLQYTQFIKAPLKDNNKTVGLIGYVNDLPKIKTLYDKLEDNESEMEFVFNNTNSAYYIKDIDLRFKRVNSAFLKLFNLKEINVLGKKSYEINDISDALLNREIIEKKILKTKIPSNQTLAIDNSKNIKKYLSIYENVLVDNNKKIIDIICTIEDVSESKNKEIELKKIYNNTINNISSENFYSYAKLDLKTESIIEFNSAKPFLKNIDINDLNALVNKIKNQMLYLEEKKEFSDFFNTKNLINISEKTNIPSLVFTFKGYDRPVAIIRISFNLLTNPKNNHPELVILSKDITEEMDLKTLVNTISSNEYDFIAKVDLILDNCSFLRMNNIDVLDFNFSQTTQRMKVKQFVDILLEDSIQTEKVKAARQALTYGKYFANQENRFYIDLNNGKRKNLIIKEIDRSKGIFFILCSDITSITKESTAIKNKLSESMEKALEANNIKSKFLASMSHDMRTPLNGIIGISTFGIEESNNLLLTDYFSKIKISSLFLLTLLNDVLDMQSIELGKIKIKKNTIDIDKNLNEIVFMVQARADEKNINFNIIKDDHPKFVQTDPIRFNQIIINLLSNAIKYTQKNGKVDFIIKYINDPKPFFEFIIKDNGFGMSHEFQKHMFEQFSTELNQNSSTEGGTGLGLSIAKNLTELLGGTIECQSKLNKGTTFIIKLPLKELSKSENRLEIDKRKKQISKKLCGKKVLICEDNYLNIIIIEKILHRENITTIVAENGRIGIQKLKENKFDAILMDIRMPIMGGIEATKEIRKFDKHIPIIALSANAYKEDIDKSLKVGMNAHLLKPIDVNSLFTTLRAFIK
ncbi:MAG: response regulator [Spirochaetaceae bacterium]|nr:response regulator [Spirochaetaceae bacterium]